MSSQLILSIKEAMVRFKDKPIFENLNFNLHQKSRIALVGKNGSGKTTLMKMIAGEIELEEGERWLENKIEIGYLNQEFINLSNKNIFQELISTINNDEEKNLHVEKLIKENFDLSPRGIREMLGLNKPIYEKTAAYGHFGRIPDDKGSFSWEKTDKSDIFSK